MKNWQRFILEHGWRAWKHELAAVLGRTLDEVEAVRRTGACRKLEHIKRFAELFTLWRGRAPRDDEWPMPRRTGTKRSYEWQPPEDALLASLVGRIDPIAIADALTTRLRKRTGDPRAQRTRWSVLVRMQKVGLQTTDVVGGITLSSAGREIGAYAAVFQAIRDGRLRAHRVGRLWVIPYEAWATWKAKHVFPPKGYVMLAKLKKPLGIRSDKLSEWARAGNVPGALRCNPYGMRMKSTQFGTWWIPGSLARKLIADRRAGRPMPWHGQPDPTGNNRVTYKLWQQRKHPPACRTCTEIWGAEGAPRTIDDYMLRYPPLAHGAKRHLTRKWSPGLTVDEVAALAGKSIPTVRSAIRNGQLETNRNGHYVYVARWEATRWRARNCPTGDGERSWISIRTASEIYLFAPYEIRRFMREGKLLSKVGTYGAQRGITYVSRQQCAMLRAKLGFTEEDAAKRIGVSPARFRILLKGVNWRAAGGIPLVTVQAVIKRLQSRAGLTIEDAAKKLSVTVQWIHERKLDGTIRVSRAKWDRRRTYISEPMMERLREAKRKPVKVDRFGPDWLFLNQAAAEAGISIAMIGRWADEGTLERRHSNLGWRYRRKDVRTRARQYWRTNRMHRAVPPEWLRRELGDVPADGVMPHRAATAMEARAA